ncbi:carboxypeptidase regulatory-like domain-containing protein [Synoicihabitans lomoniglobus]|uniref:Carboxypeptidase regulatory-like domain-containing protein n=1 Tax=Synoicihabitans lomoniglobus TaxID=2909285 RepID=A0AAE9ZY83_9BACT|nr:carboxypeptidase regulatory-like domain-containing protein [Opitutaceae bacterium LMO-M01]WED64763.1 carboxypeptidase regulatory-like domain-containing protein [Opitutaceae bacterium LMO-M01]
MFSKRAHLALWLLIGLPFTTRASELTITATDQKSTAVADLVVWLDPLDAALPAPAPSGSLSATVEQKDEEFNPYVIAVRTGTHVVFPNRDEVQHHVYSLSRPAQFEIPLHGGNVHESVVFEQAGLVPIGCNIHDWMLSYIMVVDTPWFGTTAAEGTASITGIPPGRYRLTAWHPRMRTNVEQEVTITAEDPAPVALELRLRPDRRIRRAPGAGGKGY